MQRPKILQKQQAQKQRIIKAAVSLIQKQGMEALNVRSVCQAAGIAAGTFYYYFKDKESLLMAFVMEETFEHFALKTPLNHPAKRMAELYWILIKKYQSFGKPFMRSFYTTSNTALSAYMQEKDGNFSVGTIMARSEQELLNAQQKGIVKKEAPIHQICMDLCTIVKGTIFEWCLTDEEWDIQPVLLRLFTNYLFPYLICK